MISINGVEVIPTVNRAVVRLHKREKVLPSGIILPDNVTKETDYYGEVIAVSRTETRIKKGDNVVLRKHAGVTVEIDQTDGIYKMYNINTDMFYVC